jgi:putative nucleotidyltransferase with HDIG domain
MNYSTTLHHTVDLLEALPAMPKIAHEILSLKMATENSDELLLKLIEKDPAISARVIGLSNSPLFGTSRKIMSIHDAASVLGLKRIKMIALSFAMVSSMNAHRGGLLNVLQLWQHSMAVALAMDELSRAMPKELRPPNEEIYLAGLLHDIGFLVLEYIDPELSNRFHARLASDTEHSFEEIESEMLEVDHSELGALLAQHWNLGEVIIEVLRHHHSGNAAYTAGQLPLIIMADLAERLLPPLGGLERTSQEIEIEAWLALGISADKIDAVETAMRERAAEIAAAIG